MTAQEILEGITRHRADPATTGLPDLDRKLNEIEWALQAIAERFVEIERDYDNRLIPLEDRIKVLEANDRNN